MATFRKRNDKWQARVQRSGQTSIAKSFNTKADAIKWSRNIESQLDLGTLAPKQTMPRLRPMLERYVVEVTPTKKGESQERYRASQMIKTKLADLFMDKITGEVVAKYRDQRHHLHHLKTFENEYLVWADTLPNQKKLVFEEVHEYQNGYFQIFFFDATPQ